MPLAPAARNTLSALLRVSAEPPVVEVAPENTFPKYVLPPTTTVRFRLFLYAAPLVAPGASVHASVTRNGLLASATEPVKTRVCPEAVNIRLGSSSLKTVGVTAPQLNASLRFISPMPWLLDQSVSLAPVPVM